MSSTTVVSHREISQILEFLSFDYNSIFENENSFFGYFIHPIVPVASVLLYLLFSGTLFNFLRVKFNLQPKGAILSQLTALHSAILAIYSLWTFVNTAPMVYTHMIEHGFWSTLCDANGILWHDKKFSFWLTHFYISKYYEFIDTWIVLLKGREPIFLQTFHHAGIAILMWGFVVTSATVGLVIVCLNSFIHSLMYTYYFFAAYGYKSPLKNYLTIAQIVQFLIGMSFTIPTHFIDQCLNPAQSLVLGITQLYTIILIALFIHFYIANYSNKKRKAV